mgnify:CR=1 FL=1
MIAQTLVEYGAIQSIAAAFTKAYYTLDNFFGRGNTKYLLVIGLAAIAFLFLTRRRSI